MTQIARSLAALAIFILLLGFGYTVAVTGIAYVVWPRQAQGSLVEVHGEVVGSELVAQPFTNPAYFWPRPSASGYNADPQLDPTQRAMSYPSNLGPTNPELITAIGERVMTYDEGVPVDLVTSSGSGVDPHISLASARWQADRIAQARHLDIDTVLELIEIHTQSWVGRRYVNVLRLNLALDELTGEP
jgi:K+-transporting ATPase ATPase C chain